MEGVVADAQRQVAGEHDRALWQVGVVVVALGDERRRLGIVGRDRLERVRERVERRVRVHEVVVQALVVDDRPAPLNQ